MLALRRPIAIAVLVLFLDELVKTAARLQLAPCFATSWLACDRIELVGPVWLVRAANAGSAMGLGQGLVVWVLLAAIGVLLIPLYARWLGMSSWLSALAVGLQVGGASGNLLDRLILGGATDVLYVGWGPIWNLADVALVLGTALATWRLARRSPAVTSTLGSFPTSSA